MVSLSPHCASCGAVNRPQANFCVVCGQPLQNTLPPVQTSGGGASNAPTGPVLAHRLLKQRYRIVSLLGQGGMGAVYKAEDTQLGNRAMAVKEMSQSGLSPQELQEATDAFQNEALLLAGLIHPNLPRIYEHFTEGGHWYLVMDFIEGETLEDHLSKAPGNRLPLEEVLNIGIQLCTVLDYLHTRQPPIIFRDLKPANVMLTPEGHLYLIDFGIARHFKPGKAMDTIILGSPGYAAPEQYGQAQTTPSADIYSLGATLYQLLSGTDPSLDPFQFAPLQLVHQPGFSRLETLIMQMLEMKKDKRPTNIAAIKQVLQSISVQRMTRQISPTQPAPWPTTATSLPGTVLKTKKQWLNEGKALYSAKRYEEALAAYDHALQLDPNLAQAHNTRGHILLDLKRYTEALAAFEQTIQLDPNFALAFNAKGNTLANLKRYTEALAAFDHAIQLNPNLMHAYIGKGNALSQLQRYTEALDTFEHAILLNPNLAMTYNAKGKTLFKLHRYTEALAAFEHAIQLNPHLAIAYYNKGLALERLGRTKAAQQAYERARQLGYSG